MKLWPEMLRVISDDGRQPSNTIDESSQRKALETLTIGVDTRMILIAEETADTLEAVWARMTSQVRPRQTSELGDDGVTYDVAYRTPDGAVHTGSTWSPDKGTRPAALVKLARKLAELTQTPSPALEAQIRDDAMRLRARLQ